MMKIVFLDTSTMGNDISFNAFEGLGKTVKYQNTAPDEVASRIQDADVVVINKVKLGKENLAVSSVRLICLAATGYDNVDTAYCKANGIAVCNVVGYSTQCVAQLTAAMALSLYTHLPEYNSYVKSGKYTASGVANCLTPVYHEIYGKTWGIVGYGNIGAAVGKIAEALGCRVLVHKRTPIAGVECVDFDRICKESDILSFHTPLNDATRGMLDKTHIAMLKPNAIVINVARGAVTDERALADAVKEGRIGGIGVDVYSTEPMPQTHPFFEIMDRANVCLTPHTAWGGQETRIRLLDEIAENIKAFYRGEARNRVD